MKKLILILTLLTALFLAGCTGPSYEGDQCYDNDVCSVKEEKIGGCNDCIILEEVIDKEICINDGECTKYESEIGNCEDCPILADEIDEEEFDKIEYDMPVSE